MRYENKQLDDERIGHITEIYISGNDERSSEKGTPVYKWCIIAQYLHASSYKQHGKSKLDRCYTYHRFN